MTTMKQLCQFKDSCKIEATADGYTVKDGEEILQFDRQDKPVFTYETGKTVVEFTGLATDQNSDRSWAEAIFEPNGGTAAAHFHHHRTVDYYITAGNDRAHAIIEGQEYSLPTGSHVRVLPNQVNQFINNSATEMLILLVKVTPAWTPEDHNLVKRSRREKLTTTLFHFLENVLISTRWTMHLIAPELK